LSFPTKGIKFFFWSARVTFAINAIGPMPKTYKHLFFDLDHTLWDFERNAEETKRELFHTLKLKERGIPDYDTFRGHYIGINQALWALYREDKIGKAELNFRRFYDTLCRLSIDDQKLGHAMAAGFIAGVSSKTYLFPYAQELLEYLYSRYVLHVITNGFEEVQFPKLKNSGIGRYFTSIITSEEARSKKPDPAIFNYALRKSGALASESIMIGDDLDVDIAGARQSGIDQLYVNHERKTHSETITLEVFSLDEIIGLL
jgi:putative hydrolase of the HAD superfamily